MIIPRDLPEDVKEFGWVGRAKISPKFYKCGLLIRRREKNQGVGGIK
jgi:hypothetical protein